MTQKEQCLEFASINERSARMADQMALNAYHRGDKSEAQTYHDEATRYRAQALDWRERADKE